MTSPSSEPRTFFLSAAEASGDEHAANLIRSLRQRVPDARFVGVAGPRMAAQGCEVLADLTNKAAMLGGPVLRLGYWIRKIRRIQKQLRQMKPDVHIPVDSPAMNWHLAKAARQAGCPVVYYIAPQVWAWAPWRVRKLARLTDAVACILPFEQNYLRQRGVQATYVGHPVFDRPPARPDPLPDLSDAWYSGAWRIALLPGSRQAEIQYHTAPLLQIARAVVRRWPAARCTFAILDQRNAEKIRRQIQQIGARGVDVEVGRDSLYHVLGRSHFAAAGSGTVTLQAAYFGLPMIVFYRTSLLMMTLHRTLGQFRSVVATRDFSLVNILARRRVVPEFMPWRGSPSRLVSTVVEMLDDVGCLHETRRRLLEIVEPLSVPAPGRAADNAADLILKTVQERNANS